jgi:hypothetical protein
VTVPPKEEDPVPLPEIAVEDMFIALGHARPADEPSAGASGPPERTWRRRIHAWWGDRRRAEG